MKKAIKQFVKTHFPWVRRYINPLDHRILSSFFLFFFNPVFPAMLRSYLFRKKAILEMAERHVPLPRNLYFEGTNVCNADCVFCPYTIMERPKNTMSMELFRNVVDQYVELGGRAVAFTPIVGDPMMDKFLMDRIEYLDGIDQITNIGFYTNSIGLTHKKADRLVEFKNTTINLSISFGGYDQETFKRVMGVDKFDLVQKNVSYFLDVLEERGHDGLIVKADFRCPDSQGKNSFGHRVQECIDKGLLDSATLSGSFDTFGGYVDQEKLDRAGMGLQMNFGYPKIGPCEIPFTKPLVLADGRLNACAERDLETTLTVGDLTVEPLRDLLYGPRMREFVRQFYDPDSLPMICQRCSVYQSIHNPDAKIWSENLNWSPQEQA